MENKENFKEIFEQVKNVDKGINDMIIPILKDTIKDGNRTNKKLFIFAMFELLIIVVITIVSLFLIYKQNLKYQEFLSEFEFETVETVYQDLDSGEGDINQPVINHKINN